jgi:hypothetical protein
MTLIIEPYEAVGYLKFGMNHDDIVASMGEPLRSTTSRGGNTILWYDDNKLNLILENDHLVEVGFAPDMPVSIRGIHPFTDPDAFASLCKLDGSPCEVLGFIVFRRLGITLTGFHDKDESQKALTAFTSGRWDALESQMKPFHFQPAGPRSPS